MVRGAGSLQFVTCVSTACVVDWQSHHIFTADMAGTVIPD